MAINERLIHTAAEAAAGGGTGNQEEGLILHLDANDVDSYDGDGSVWYDISEHDITIPLSDNADDLELHLNASDTTSYDPATDTTTWTDISGNSRDATLTSLTNTDHDIDNGGYFDFTGSSDFMSVANDSTLDINSSGWAFEIWLTKDTTSNLYFASKSQGIGSYGWRCRWGGADGYTMFVYDSSNNRTTVKTGVPTGATDTGEWHHVVFSYDGTNWKTYFNGEFALQISRVGNQPVSNSHDMEIGRDSLTDANYWNGKIGAVRIYSKALSASEVGQNYRHGRDYIYTDLVDDTDLELHLDAGNTDSYDPSSGGSTWSDLTAGNHNATLTSMNASQHDTEIGGWFEFDAANDYGVISGSSDLYMSGAGFTIEAWVNRDDNGEGYIISSKDTTNYPYALTYHPTLGYYGWLSGSSFSGGAAVSTGTGIGNGTGKFDHVVMVQDGTDRKNRIYVNGVHKGSPSSAQSGSHSSTADVHIGTYHNFTNKWDGKIGQVRIYDKGLTADEIMQNYRFTKNDYPNGYNGTLSGGLSSSDWSSSGYFNLDGSADYISLATSAMMSGDFTISMWWYFDSLSGYQMLWGSQDYGSGGAGGLGHYIEDAKINTWVANGSASSVNVMTSGSVLSTSTWHHIVITRSGSSTVAYVDSVSVATGTYSGELTASNTKIGAHYHSSLYNVDGRVGAVKEYEKALTASEVLAEYNATKSTYGL